MVGDYEKTEKDFGVFRELFGGFGSNSKDFVGENAMLGALGFSRGWRPEKLHVVRKL